MGSKILIHPGEFIKEELEAREWSQRDLAYILGCPEQAITAIVNGKRGITPDMAKALALAFEVSPELFTNLQQAYDLAKADEPDPSISVRQLIQSNYPAREMIKRGWLNNTKDSELLEAQIAQFFGVSDLKEVPHLSHAARKSYYDSIPSAQLAWLFRVKNLAKNIKAPKYSEKDLRKILPELRRLLLLPEDIKNVPNILLKTGVRFLIVEGLPSSKIDGVCFWLNEYSPVICLSMRFDRIDNFWFNLRHEIEHVLRRDGSEEEVIDVELGKGSVVDRKIREMEDAANLAASNFIIPPDELDQFLSQNQSYISLKSILEFARKLEVHPGLVIGQLQNKQVIPYATFRKCLVKVRNLIVPEVEIVDGWGLTLK
jgi:HTH-type transcriptional regulator/antitoxin HigA